MKITEKIIREYCGIWKSGLSKEVRKIGIEQLNEENLNWIASEWAYRIEHIPEPELERWKNDPSVVEEYECVKKVRENYPLLSGLGESLESTYTEPQEEFHHDGGKRLIDALKSCLDADV